MRFPAQGVERSESVSSVALFDSASESERTKIWGLKGEKKVSV